MRKVDETNTRYTTTWWDLAEIQTSQILTIKYLNC